VDDHMKTLDESTKTLEGGSIKINKMHQITSEIQEQAIIGASTLKEQGQRIKDQIDNVDVIDEGKAIYNIRHARSKGYFK
jgi:uncharacterized protein YnzC (UPF0291/DUF896 family)